MTGCKVSGTHFKWLGLNEAKWSDPNLNQKFVDFLVNEKCWILWSNEWNLLSTHISKANML